jgi:hypothetical protein
LEIPPFSPRREGREYHPMSFMAKNMSWGREKGENVKEKEKREKKKEKRKWGVKG